VNPATSRRQSLLRNALLGNAGFSLFSAVIIFSGQGKLMRLLGLRSQFNALFLAMALLAFAIWLLLNAARGQIKLRDARLAVAMDFAWVVTSLLVLVFIHLTGPGKLVVAVTAAIVLSFALSQWIGIRRIANASQGKAKEARGA
jgi:cytochrome bd-type quinol oxidase subunit 2